MTTIIDTDATHILAHGHRDAEDLFAKFEKAGGLEAKAGIANKLCDELKIHMTIEEEIFYPALEGKIDAGDLKEAYVEHDGAKMLINEIAEGNPQEEFYDAKMKVLKEEIEHHIKEEEKQQGNMFQQARATDVDLDLVGEQMLERKDELKKLARTNGLPPARMRTA